MLWETPFSISCRLWAVVNSPPDEQKRKCAAMPPENIEVYLDALQTTAEALLDIIANLRAELDYQE